MAKREKLIDYLEKLPPKTDVGFVGTWTIFINAPVEKMIEVVRDRYMDCYVWNCDFNKDKTKVAIQLCLKNGVSLLNGRENEK